MDRPGRRALTEGWPVLLSAVVVAVREPDPVIWRHELRHVRQYERLGLAFLPVYLRLLARHGYARHPLEREASRGE